MAPGLTGTVEASSPGIAANEATLCANPGGPQVNGKQDSTENEPSTVPLKMESEVPSGAEENEAGHVLEEPQPEAATMSENAFENEHSKILFEAIDQLHSLGAGQLNIPQVRPPSQYR